MKCGSCKGDHSSVEDVRRCYGVALQPVEVSPSVSTTEPVWPDRTPRGEQRSAVPGDLLVADAITPKQEAFLNKLLDERPALRDVENLWPENVAKMSKRDASRKIDEIINTPKEVAAPKSGLNELLAGIEDGYFALPSKTGNNDLDFIRIGTNQGQYDPNRKGWRKMQRVVGGRPDTTMRISEAMEFAKVIVALTDEERKASQVLYGRELGFCGVCNRHLTDETSRALGIGPVCREGF